MWREPGSLDAVLRSRLECILRYRIDAWRLVEGGYTPALRMVLRVADGTSCFAKVATNDSTAEWLRAEHHFYAHATPAFIPKHIASEDHPTAPLMLLEDLSRQDWSVRWDAKRVQAVRDAIEQTSQLDLPGLPPLHTIESLRDGWLDVQHDPRPFLGLGLASAAWLQQALPTLIEATANARLDGDTVLHGDLRSDNLCFRADGSAVLIDWNSACRGDASFDLAAWAPSLASEGGPMPESVAGDVPQLAALLAGFFASRAPDCPTPTTRLAFEQCNFRSCVTPCHGQRERWAWPRLMAPGVDFARLAHDRSTRHALAPNPSSHPAYE